MKKRERERENASTEAEAQEKNRAKRNYAHTARDTRPIPNKPKQGIPDKISKLYYPLAADRTSLEIHYSRSKRIREAVWRFMYEHQGDYYEDISEAIREVANVSRCSTETAARWFYQFAARTGDFRLTLQQHSWVMREDK